MKLLKVLEKSKSCWFIIASFVFFFLLRFPSLFEPNWYGDEGIYQVLGLGINHGRLLYRDIFDNKPPLLYLLYSIFNSDQFMVRLASLIFGLIAVFVFFKLCQKILNSNKASYIATFVFALLFGLPLIEGNIANAENFMLLFGITGAFLAFKSITAPENKRYKLLFYTGIVLGISFLFKIVAVFDFAAIFMFLFFANFSKNIKDILKPQNLITEFKNLSPLIIGFVILPVLVALYFFLNGAFPYFLKATLTNNVGYVGYGNKFIIPQGLLILKLLLLFGASGFVFIKRKVLGNGAVLAYLWLFFSLFSAFFSQRPYTHYVLVVLPALCLVVGLVTLKNKYIKFNLLVLLITIFLLATNFTYFLRTVYYYQNFISFVTNNKTLSSYQSFFDGNTPNDYALASYINMSVNKNDNIFIWGNNAQVYTLTNKLPPGRYAVAYHISSYKDGLQNTQDGLRKSNPKLIIIMSNVPTYPFSLLGYALKINLNGTEIYERVY